MKYVIIIPAGAADAPIDDLDGLTPLEAAEMPNLAALTRQGRLGTVRTIPDGYPADTDIALLTLLGYDVSENASGRAGFIAVPLQVNLEKNDWAFCLSFITVDPETGQLIHPTAGYVEPTEARLLLQSLSEAIADQLGDEAADIEFFAGHAEDHLLVDRTGTHRYDDLITTSPIDLVGKPIRKFLPHVAGMSRGPSKESARLLNEIMEFSAGVFESHEVNQTRAELGDPLASRIWLWGEGRRPHLLPFKKRFPKLRSAIVTTDDLAGGVAQAAGWKRLDLYEHEKRFAEALPRGGDLISLPVMADLARCAERAVRSDEFDLIAVYVEAPDEAAYEGDFAGKITVMENIDRDVVGPIWKALTENADVEEGQWRLIVVPDVCTLTAEQKRDSRPVPFLLAGASVKSVLQHEAFNESTAAEADLHIESGCDFLEYALYSGLLARK